MAVAGLHSKLFETYARELDRQVRAQLVGIDLRPDYTKDFQRDLDHILAISQSGIEIGGRFLWAKKLLRRVLRPVLFHQDRVHRLLVERLAELRSELHDLHRAMNSVADRLWDETTAETESLRREVLGELERRLGGRAGSLSPNGGAGDPLPPGARLVLGHAPARRPGFVHLGVVSGPTVDRVARLDALPVAPGSISEIAVAGAVERYSLEDLRRRVLPHWRDVLAPGGRIVIAADDAQAALDRHQGGQLDLAELVAAFFGDDDAEGLARRSAVSPELLSELLLGAGFERPRLLERRGEPLAGVFAFEVEAFRPVLNGRAGTR